MRVTYYRTADGDGRAPEPFEQFVLERPRADARVAAASSSFASSCRPGSSGSAVYGRSGLSHAPEQNWATIPPGRRKASIC
jgi:hypothetical protein